MPRQLPLFSAEPQTPEDLSRNSPFRHALPFFAQHLQKEGKSDHTVKAFIADLNLLAEHAGEDRALGDFHTSTLNRFLEWMENGRGVPCSRKTYARRVTSLKVFFKWLKGLDAIPTDPALKVLQRSGAAPLSYALNPDEIHRAARFARTMKRREEHDTRPEVLFRLVLDTGIKKSEAMRLIVNDIKREDPERPYLHVYHTARNVYKERKIDLDPDWLTIFDEYKLQYGITDKVFTCTARNLEYILRDISVGADIPAQISFEVLRWSSAVRDARAGVDADVIREKLGLSRVSWQETGTKVQQLVDLQLRQEAGTAGAR